MDFREVKKRLLESPTVKAEYEKLIPEYQIIREIINGRKEKHYSQQKLADLTGINRADISRLENGNANPSLSTIERIASAFGKRVDIRFFDLDQSIQTEWISPTKVFFGAKDSCEYLQESVAKLVGNSVLNVSEEKSIEYYGWNLNAKKWREGDNEWVEVA